MSCVRKQLQPILSFSKARLSCFWTHQFTEKKQTKHRGTSCRVTHQTTSWNVPVSHLCIPATWLCIQLPANTHPWRPKKMAQICESLPCTWESRMASLCPSLLWLIQKNLGEWTNDGKISFLLSFKFSNKS